MENMVEQDYETFDLGRFELQSGAVLPSASLAYRTYGAMNAKRDNVIILPTFYTGTHARNEGFFGVGRAIDPNRHFIVSINMFGNGLSSSPSNTASPFDGPRFPEVTLYDNVKAQHRLLTERLSVDRVALVAGWSMAGCQAYHWSAQYPEMVGAIMPVCASARTSPHNVVFLEGVKAALQADQTWNSGDYKVKPEKGLRAFGRVYAGWAYSQTFFRERLYQKLGFETFEDLLVDWENDHLNWDANDLLAMLKTWQKGNIAANALYQGNFALALNAITARAIVLPCRQDLYFPPEDNALEVQHMRHAELRVYDSAWGHCVASPGSEPAFDRFFDQCVNTLLENKG